MLHACLKKNGYNAMSPALDMVKIFLFSLVLALAGCATATRSYHSESTQTIKQAASKSLDQALADLEAKPDKDLLYHMEKGELLRLQNNIPESLKTWLTADESVRAWEEEAKLNPDKLIGDISSFVVNDKFRRYEGFDFEKVLLTTRLALDHIALGKWDNARTEIKKTHEREAVIAELRAKELVKIEQEAKARNISVQYKDLQGYPVESLDDPAVAALRNSYQNAFSHYLAGFVYEALGEPSLAAPGYRKAIELRPGVPILEDALKNLHKARPRANETVALFVVEAGMAPARESKSFTVPVPTVGAISISFPVIHPDTRTYVPKQLEIEGRGAIPLAAVTNLDLMARRTLKDEMTGIITRSVIRATGRGLAQKKAMEVGGGMLGTFGSLMSTAGVATGIATETADERSWRLLPAQIAIGRAILPSGKYTLSVPTSSGVKKVNADISGKYAVVPVRLLEPTVYLVQNTQPLSLAQAETPPPSIEEVKSAKEPKVPTRKKVMSKTKP